MVLTTNEVTTLNDMKSKGTLSTCMGKFRPKDEVCEHNLYNVKAPDCVACHGMRNDETIKKKYDSGETINEWKERINTIITT